MQYIYPSSSIVVRFFKNIKITEPNKCRPYKYGLTESGYGQFHYNYRTVRANRFALELKLGRPLKKGMEACHTCDNPSCCYYGHLYEGTRRQNSLDYYTRHKSNIRQGVNNPAAKLTEEDVQHIRNMLNKGVTQRKLAITLNISRSVIADISARRTWTHV